MNLLQKLWFLLMFLTISMVSAQYTGVINSNRPGFSESPYSVGTGIYQLETSIFYRKTQIVPTFSRPQSNGIDFLFRTSFFKERLELNLNFRYQRDQIAFQNIFTSSYFKGGISNLTIAGKYLLYEHKYKDKSKEVRSWVERHRFDWSRLIPSVAVYAGINPGIESDIFSTGGFSPKAGVLLQNDLTRDLNVVTNLFYDKITTPLPEFSYIVTATYSFNDRWSTFFENQTIFTKTRTSTNLGSGIAFLFNRNLQINSSLRLIAEGKAKGFYTSFGASYRLDKHKDEVIEVDEYGNPIEEEVETVKKKGFFGRLFGKVTGIFKSKKKKAANNVELKDKTIESIRKNTNKDEINLNNDTIQKATPKPIRTRPKRVRVRPSKIKPVKDKTKKGLFGFLKGKTAEEKEKAKKDKQAEKEKKRLEKEKKKQEAKKKKEEKKKNKNSGKKEDENG
ncbi:transporter [Pseudotenacibaculum sp. MALMAid0570]|uniref:transporter n=1 Tax=Pseudotenacibaculum sp. MALMAid0570 TaxID=3143938 RepID=UPI0032DE5BE6